ncbi:unnamed protein product [Vicia faba]|uniref:Uncharacterized protein n=1 Tax=Vicia faba TaxID=3906 RepID=A0AAV1A5A4_VICFA|nr:unnamed protein product [Vicia faba]
MPPKMIRKKGVTKGKGKVPQVTNEPENAFDLIDDEFDLSSLRHMRYNWDIKENAYYLCIGNKKIFNFDDPTAVEDNVDAHEMEEQHIGGNNEEDINMADGDYAEDNAWMRATDNQERWTQQSDGRYHEHGSSSQDKRYEEEVIWRENVQAIEDARYKQVQEHIASQDANIDLFESSVNA